jgi:capsular polysaccharide biosynthesis protein
LTIFEPRGRFPEADYEPYTRRPSAYRTRKASRDLRQFEEFLAKQTARVVEAVQQGKGADAEQLLSELHADCGREAVEELVEALLEERGLEAARPLLLVLYDTFEGLALGVWAALEPWERDEANEDALAAERGAR